LTCQKGKIDSKKLSVSHPDARDKVASGIKCGRCSSSVLCCAHSIVVVLTDENSLKYKFLLK